MTFVMWTVWAAFVVFTAALYIYRSSLTRDEEDQIFLDDSFQHEKNRAGDHRFQSCQGRAACAHRHLAGRWYVRGRSHLLRARHHDPAPFDRVTRHSPLPAPCGEPLSHGRNSCAQSQPQHHRAAGCWRSCPRDRFLTQLVDHVESVVDHNNKRRRADQRENQPLQWLDLLDLNGNRRLL